MLKSNQNELDTKDLSILQDVTRYAKKLDFKEASRLIEKLSEDGQRVAQARFPNAYFYESPNFKNLADNDSSVQEYVSSRFIPLEELSKFENLLGSDYNDTAKNNFIKSFKSLDGKNDPILYSTYKDIPLFKKAEAIGFEQPAETITSLMEEDCPDPSSFCIF